VLSAEDLKEIQRLHTRLGRETDAHFVGEYLSAFRGQGMEFENVRQYSPGDDVRRIDWNVTARTGYPHVKEFRESREMSVMLAVDVSSSMKFAEKIRVCSRLAGAIAFAAMRNQDRVGLILFGEKIHRVLPPKKKNGYVWQIIQEVFAHNFDSKGSNFKLLADEIQQVLPRRTILCVISDFLSPDWREIIPLRSRHRLHALMVHDVLEHNIGFKGLLDVVDSESGQSRLIDTTATQFIPVEQRIRQLREAGIAHCSFSAEEDAITSLLGHFRRSAKQR
jgi:uncharacterized protein (DUF58 family)